MHCVLFLLICFASHSFVLSLLSVRRWQLDQTRAGKPAKPVAPGVIRALGMFTAVETLALPYALLGDPLQQCGARIVCFFYAFKVLDLALTKVDEPPKLLGAPSGEDGALSDYGKHAWFLLTDMRYHHFDIQVKQKGRPPVEARRLPRAMLTGMVLAGTAYAVPVTETKCLLLLYLIQNALEGIHTLLHPYCEHHVFYTPFSAATLGDFWTTHWHTSAVFLQSLAYRPGRRLLGRWFGVLAAFALSGAWHGWASATLVDDAHAVTLGRQVWAFFVMLGVGSLAERIIWQNRQGGVVQRVVVWIYALAWAGWCFRTLQCHSKIAFLRDESCCKARLSTVSRYA